MNAVIRLTEPGSSAGEEPWSAHPAALVSGPQARCQTTAAGSGRRPALFHAPSTAGPGPAAPPTTSRNPRCAPATPAHTHPCPRASRCFGRPLHVAGDGGPILPLAVAVTGRAKQIRSPAVCIAPCLHMNALQKEGRCSSMSVKAAVMELPTHALRRYLAFLGRQRGTNEVANDAAAAAAATAAVQGLWWGHPCTGRGLWCAPLAGGAHAGGCTTDK